MTFKLELGLNRELMAMLTRWCQTGPADQGGLDEVLKKLDGLKIQGEIMAQDLKDRMAIIDANTTRTGAAVAVVAERIRLLSEQVASGKLTEAEYQEVAAELSRLADFSGTVATNLELVAAGPQEPPPIDPETVPEVTA